MLRVFLHEQRGAMGGVGGSNVRTGMLVKRFRWRLRVVQRAAHGYVATRKARLLAMERMWDRMWRMQAVEARKALEAAERANIARRAAESEAAIERAGNMFPMLDKVRSPCAGQHVAAPLPFRSSRAATGCIAMLVHPHRSNLHAVCALVSRHVTAVGGDRALHACVEGAAAPAD